MRGTVVVTFQRFSCARSGPLRSVLGTRQKVATRRRAAVGWLHVVAARGARVCGWGDPPRLGGVHEHDHFGDGAQRLGGKVRAEADG